MPRKRGESVSRTIAREVESGYGRKQAAAIAYSEKRREIAHKRIPYDKKVRELRELSPIVKGRAHSAELDRLIETHALLSKGKKPKKHPRSWLK